MSRNCNLHVIFCGQLRRTQNFANELRKCYNLKQEGLISDIRWAVWEDEIEAIPLEINELLKRFEVRIVSVEKIDLAGKQISGVFQYRLLQAGLYDIPEKDYVIKSRPDVIVPILRLHEYCEAVPTYEVDDWIFSNWGIRNKFFVNWFNPGEYFTFCDLSYVGRVSDLKVLADWNRCIGYAQVNHNALCHLGNLAFPVSGSAALNPYYRWLETYYPGMLARRESGRALWAYRPLFQLFLDATYADPFIHWQMLWSIEGSFGAQLGWDFYLKTTSSLFVFPVLSLNSRVKLADRTYWADDWQEIDHCVPLVERQRCGRGGHRFIEHMKTLELGGVRLSLDSTSQEVFCIAPAEERTLLMRVFRGYLGCAFMIAQGRIKVWLGRLKADLWRRLGKRA
jgi:hypothetical protein